MKRMIAILAAVLASAGPSFAHSFDVLLVVPDDRAIALEMQSAFLLAAEERDAHPGNHADGHLGGLDVYLLVTGAGNRDADVAAGAEVVIDLLPGAETAMEADASFRIAPDMLAELDRDALLATPAGPGLEPFDVRFRQAVGREPGAEATSVYLAGRLIDLIVRPLDSADDPGALAAEFGKLR